MTFFKGIFQVVNSTYICDIKYIFKFDDIILDFSMAQLL